MSRSNPESGSSNPCVRWFQWEAIGKCFSYWDKSKEERVEVQPPFVFLVLDHLATVTGYSEKYESGIYSNEVRIKDLKKTQLIVKAHKSGELIAQGFWMDIRDHVKAIGGSFAYSLYVLANIDGEKQLANIKMRGAALGAWMDFCDNASVYEGAVAWDGDVVQGKKGSVVFFSPVFVQKDVSEETNKLAIEIDKNVLQPHLSAYLEDQDTAKYIPVAVEQPSRQQKVTVPHDDSGLSEDIPF